MRKSGNIEIVKPKQSNYDTYFIPKEVHDLNQDIHEMPLYRLVSYWGLKKDDYFCRDDIATAFGISLRQASGIISAIYRKHEEIKCSVRRVKAGKGNIIKSYILIHQILNREKKRRIKEGIATVQRTMKARKVQVKEKELWSQLLTKSNFQSS